MIEVRENPHIQAASVSRRPTSWWVAILLGLVAVLVSQILVGSVLISAFDLDEGSVGSQIVEGVVGAVLIGMVLLWARYREVRPARSVGFTGRRGMPRFLVGIVIGAAMFSAVALLMLAFGGIERIDPPGVSTGWPVLIPVLLLALTYFLQGTSEETLFRGIIFQWSGLQLPAWPAILIPSVVFTLLHLTSDGAFSSPLPVINLLMFSLFATFVVLADRGLWLIAGIHAGWNWFEGNVFGTAVSGTLNDRTLMAFGATDESVVLSGGDFGPEGTIGATLVLTAAAIVTWRVLASKKPS